MYDYSEQIEAFRYDKVRLKHEFKGKLYQHRSSNRNRLITRLPERIPGLQISLSSFKPQGSAAVDTIIQTIFVNEEYDIDDGIVLRKEDLVDENGNELSAEEVKMRVLKSLKDKRFIKQPKMAANAIRVFYKEDDEERHHVDFPVYRKYQNDDGQTIRELAGENGWVESDPTQVNDWFKRQVEQGNSTCDGQGTQMRHLIQLLKRFCRSRYNWDLPNGMKLTMLVAECQPAYSSRIDIAFRELLEALELRLSYDKVIRNLAHPDQPEISRTTSDSNVEELEVRVREALEYLRSLDADDSNNRVTARKAWDWIFQSDGYFKAHDDKLKEAEERDKKLEASARLINAGNARTSALGVIGSCGTTNQPHEFYGD